jgi:uncharacterized protein YciI
MDFDSFTVVLLIRADDAPELTAQQRDALQDAHLAFLADLHEGGQLVASGPVRDPDSEVRGISLMQVGVEEALRLGAEDPVVRAGVFRLRALPWSVPASVLRGGPGTLPRSIAQALG